MWSKGIIVLATFILSIVLSPSFSRGKENVLITLRDLITIQLKFLIHSYQ